MHKLIIKILGCGASGGVPIPCCGCSTCCSSDEKNHRTRTSLYVKTSDNKRILIDAGPDLRNQMVREKIGYFDKVLFTHKHLDHIAGVDDLRAAFFNKKSANNDEDVQIECFGHADTMNALYSVNFAHMFQVDSVLQPTFNIKPLFGKIVDFGETIELFGMKITCLEQQHSKIKSLGYLFPNFAYSTDVSDMPSESLDALKSARLKLWIVSLTVFEGNKSHASLDKLKEWIEYVQPERVIFTHMSHQIGCDMTDMLPKNCEYGYDGMEIVL